MFYFHGYLENGHSDISVIAIRNAYMDRNDHNVVTIDWSYYSKNYFYFLNVIPQMMLVSCVKFPFNLNVLKFLFCYQDRRRIHSPFRGFPRQGLQHRQRAHGWSFFRRSNGWKNRSRVAGNQSWKIGDS